jgi:hypothetical protein
LRGGREAGGEEHTCNFHLLLLTAEILMFLFPTFAVLLPPRPSYHCSSQYALSRSRSIHSDIRKFTCVLLAII